MPAYKNKDNGTWYVMTQYTNWKGERKPKCKRGFDTKREAQEWEHTFRQQNSGDLDMPFSAFVEIYCREQKPRLKESTWQTKENIIQQKILQKEFYKFNDLPSPEFEIMYDCETPLITPLPFARISSFSQILIWVSPSGIPALPCSYLVNGKAVSVAVVSVRP